MVALTCLSSIWSLAESSWSCAEASGLGLLRSLPKAAEPASPGACGASLWRLTEAKTGGSRSRAWSPSEPEPGSSSPIL
jgi:hypothetical protein